MHCGDSSVCGRHGLVQQRTLADLQLVRLLFIGGALWDRPDRPCIGQGPSCCAAAGMHSRSSLVTPHAAAAQPVHRAVYCAGRQQLAPDHEVCKAGVGRGGGGQTGRKGWRQCAAELGWWHGALVGSSTPRRDDWGRQTLGQGVPSHDMYCAQVCPGVRHATLC